tara:strand:+ start:64 stop:612 length:549 start_codon:yes stop_codon:yes gene_type:complete
MWGQLIAAAATIFGALEAKKSASKARKQQRTATAQANAAAKAALEESIKNRETQSGYFEDSLADSQERLTLLTQDQEKASVQRQAQIDAYNKMVDVQRDQFTQSQQALQEESKRYKQDRADAQQREAAIQKEIEDQRREQGEKDSAMAKARRRRGGKRGLLSQTRLNPETGLSGLQTTLGSS